ncbi:hypothetical protein TNCV_2583101 [Trichonephila clavipes]|nr:hypothetical protein TNCV_2583101 [Trichonephila clavipes]
MLGSNHISKYNNIFVDWLTDSNSILLNTTVPTYKNSAGKSSLIDLTICSSSLSGYTGCYASACFFKSDYSPVITQFLLLKPTKRSLAKIDWQLGLDSNPGEVMDVSKCIVPLRRGGTLNSYRAASPLVRLVDGKEKWEAPLPLPECSLSKLGRIRAKSYCYLYGAQGYGQRQAYI